MFVLYKNVKALQPDFTIKKQNILIQDDMIYDVLEVDELPNKPLDEEINLEGKFVFPGLINAHDHLIDTLWKKFGTTPADTWIEWRESVINDEDYKLAQRLSVADLYTLGMYKNIISGSTTIVDHFPTEVSLPFIGHELTSLLRYAYIAHSVSEERLKWCGNLEEEYRKTNGILPFIIHMGEGNSKILKEELETLNRMGALSTNTVLVNGTYLDEEDINLIADKGASLVWLPNSSKNIYGKQPNIEACLKAGVKIAIGTDGANTGSSIIQEEFKTAMEYANEFSSPLLSPEDLTRMGTINGAEIFHQKEVGSIAPSKTANLIVFKSKLGTDVFESFINLQPEDINLVIHKGKMVFGDNEFRRIPTVDFNQYSEIKLNGNTKVIYGQPLQLLERIRHKLDMDISFPFFNINTDD